jgi:hypothetical protein
VGRDCVVSFWFLVNVVKCRGCLLFISYSVVLFVFYNCVICTYRFYSHSTSLASCYPYIKQY